MIRPGIQIISAHDYSLKNNADNRDHAELRLWMHPQHRHVTCIRASPEVTGLGLQHGLRANPRLGGYNSIALSGDRPRRRERVPCPLSSYATIHGDGRKRERKAGFTRLLRVTEFSGMAEYLMSSGA